MAVSKRTRFEVLRRDGHKCRYCGATAPDVKLTVDHVIPVALGGTDDPTNLVTACADCNSGKTSTSPDSELVAQVDADALRWAAAMRRAAEMDAEKRASDAQLCREFLAIWHQWGLNDGKGTPFHLPEDWESSVLRQINGGLSMDDLGAAVDVAMKGGRFVRNEFNYFMGVCKQMRDKRIAEARELIAEGFDGE